MQQIITPENVSVSYEKYGSGPPLVLVHGSFSGPIANWEFVKPLFEERFTVYALARRGRGETSATHDHSLEDEGRDVVALIRAIGEPVFLLGHSHGAQVVLAAAAQVPETVRQLVLYEAPWPHLIGKEPLSRLEALARAGDWDGFAYAFHRDVLRVPVEELQELYSTEPWSSIVRDAPATLGDLRALHEYEFQPERFRKLEMPVLLQTGSESPRGLYVTDALAAVLPNVSIDELPGQAHEGMTTAPTLYAESVKRFLCE